MIFRSGLRRCRRGSYPKSRRSRRADVLAAVISVVEAGLELPAYCHAAAGTDLTTSVGGGDAGQLGFQRRGFCPRRCGR